MATTQIIIVRHAEKQASTDVPDEELDITCDGERRARWLGRALAGFDHPLTAIYTSHHLRTRRTAAVAVAESGLASPTPIEVVPAASADEAEERRNVDAMARSLADRIRAAARSNDIILVVHHTNTIPAIARALRASTAAPATVAHDDFRQLWCIAIGDREGEKIGTYPDPIPAT